ncbi:MAG: glutathione S-transferase family protein [Pseudomonadota bacterium]
MRLYHSAYSSNARRVVIAAEELGVPLDLVEVDLMNPADRKHLAGINFNCKVPVLQDGDFLLWESCAIMQYLAEQAPGQTLYPAGVRARADVNRWMFWACQHFAPAIGVLTWEHLWKGMTGNGDADPRELKRGAADIAAYASVLDKQLSGRQWLVGEALTLADIAVAAPLMYLESARLPFKGYSNILRWLGQLQARESWRHTEVQLQPLAA